MKTWKIVKVKYDNNVKIIKTEPNSICDFLNENPKLNEPVYLTYRRHWWIFWQRQGQLSDAGFIRLCERIAESTVPFTVEDIFILEDKTI